MLLLTIGILLVLAVLSYSMFDRDVSAPPTVVAFVMLFGALSTFYNADLWGLDFSEDTVLIIVSGVSAFIVGGIFAVIIANIHSLDKIGFSHRLSKIEAIQINKAKTVFVILIELMVVVWLFFQMRQLTGGLVWYDVVSSFRHQKMLDPDDYIFRLPVLLKQCISISFYIAFVYCYIVGNNIAARVKQPFLNWVPIILSTIMAFMQGYRSDMLRFWIAILVVTYTLKKRSVGWKRGKETKKLLKNILFSALGIALIFVVVRTFVGRGSEKDPFAYLTFYAGCPLAAFDAFVKNPLRPSDILGKETFYTLNLNIGILLNIPELSSYKFFKEFRQSPNGTWIGNVYTGFRPPYYDFGYAGMILLMIIMGLFFTYFYLKIRDKYGNKPIDFRLLMYSYVSYTFFMYFYNCYNTFISLSIVKAALIFYAFCTFLFNINFKTNINKKVKESSMPQNFER